MSGGKTITLINKDCRKAMKKMEANSIDAIVCDPPYELGFMGKSWDQAGVAFDPKTWKEALRVLKPGGHLLAFGGTRTFHRLAVAIEDAGFEIRDCLSWMYGSGFPKSMDVSKAIDKAAGAERAVRNSGQRDKDGSNINFGMKNRCEDCGKPYFSGNPCKCPRPEKMAVTPEAEQWQGWGTALKPAWEPIIVARKPLVGTVAANVLAHGTGALNISATRIGFQDGEKPPSTNRRKSKARNVGTTDGGWEVRGSAEVYAAEHHGEDQGRWPANVILDKKAGKILDEQTGNLGKSQGGFTPGSTGTMGSSTGRYGKASGEKSTRKTTGFGDEGGASRFFYCAKTSKKERNEGLPDGMVNNHPTVKPVAVMAWLVRLVTPPGGVVLDPFMGSGTTGVAVVSEGFRFIGIDSDTEHDYIKIAKFRIKHAKKNRKK